VGRRNSDSGPDQAIPKLGLDSRPPRREQITWLSFSPDNVHETGVSPGGQSGSPVVAAEAEEVERLEERPGQASDPRCAIQAYPPVVPAAYPLLVRPVEAVLVDAGGVLVLPDRAVVSASLGPGPWLEAPEANGPGALPRHSRCGRGASRERQRDLSRAWDLALRIRLIASASAITIAAAPHQPSLRSMKSQ
jgi:hypothetical protein